MIEASTIQAESPKTQNNTLRQAEVVCINRKLLNLSINFLTLIDLFQSIDHNSPRAKKILFTLNDVINRWQDGEEVDYALNATSKLLKNRSNNSSVTAYSIGQGHLGIAWLWPTREAKNKIARTFSSALNLIKEYPQYKFGASQAQSYKWIKDSHPKIYEKVRRAIKDKRWECQGGFWTEANPVLISGESLVRQCLYGKKFFKEEFDQEMSQAWLPNIFGFPASLPQILKKCEMEYLISQSPSCDETGSFPHNTFYWEGIDGSQILSHFLPTKRDDQHNIPNHLIQAEKKYAQSNVSEEFLNLYGANDGGGPSRYHIEIGKRLENCEDVPKFKFAFTNEFIGKISKIKKDLLPKWSGEIYLDRNQGTYTSQSLMKKFNRVLEHRLRDIEFLGALTEVFPTNQIKCIWEDTLYNQFHNILSGSSHKQVYQQVHSISKRNIESLGEILDELLTKMHPLKAAKESEKRRFIIYNTLSWRRKEQITLPFTSDEYVVSDFKKLLLSSSLCNGLLKVEVDTPPLGFSIIEVSREKHSFLSKKINKVKATKNSMENDLISIKLDRAGVITSIYDKDVRREVVKEYANKLMIYEDQPSECEAKCIDHFYKDSPSFQLKRESAKVEYCNHLGACITQNFRFGKSQIEQKIILHKGSKSVEIRNKADWQESKKMLKVLAKADIHTSYATYEIQYGNIKRPTAKNYSWEQTRFGTDTYGHRFADISEPNYGLALINDCKYGYSIHENNLELSLLRSPKTPDPSADMGIHEFTYCYYPHKGDLEHSKTLRKAHQLNSPLIIREISNEEIMEERSYFNVSDKNIKIEVVKRSLNDEDIILRIYEAMGMSTKTELRTFHEYKGFYESTMLETKEKKIHGKGKICPLTFKPFEIKTLCLKKIP